MNYSNSYVCRMVSITLVSLLLLRLQGAKLLTRIVPIELAIFTLHCGMRFGMYESRVETLRLGLKVKCSIGGGKTARAALQLRRNHSQASRENP